MIRSKSLMRLAIAASACSVFLLAAAGVRASNFGGWFWNGAKYGDLVNLGVPNTNNYTASTEFVLTRVGVQTTETSSAGLIQVGYYTSGSNEELDNCGTTTQQFYLYFLEWRQPNGTCNCAILDQTVPAYPSNCPGSVAEVTNTTDWDAILGCSRTDLGDYSISSDTGYPMVGGEINGSTTNCSTTDGGYGYGGNDEWSVYMHSDRGSPAQIENPANTSQLTPSTNWNVPEVPTPFSISHTGGC